MITLTRNRNDRLELLVLCTDTDITAADISLLRDTTDEFGKRALDVGAIPGYDMISETAMTKLMWILGNYPDYNISEIKKLFLKNICGEISNARTPKEKRVWEYAL